MTGCSDGDLRFWNLQNSTPVIGKVIHFGKPPLLPNSTMGTRRAVNDPYRSCPGVNLLNAARAGTIPDPYTSFQSQTTADPNSMLSGVTSLCFSGPEDDGSNDPRFLAVGFDNGFLRVLNFPSLQPAVVRECASERISTMQFSPNQRWL